jgi:hypothetical protein
MKYDVTAIGLNPETGAVVGGPRTERVDPQTNIVFEGCKAPREIADVYEAFWNRLVKVLRVDEVR